MTATADEIRHELAALDGLAVELEGERDAIHAQIAADLFAPTTPHEGKLAGIAARLAAIPRRRAELEAQLAAVNHEAALEQLEEVYRRAYALEEAADQLEGQIERLQAEIAALATRRHDLMLERSNTMVKVAQRGSSITNEEHTAIRDRWHFTPPRQPDYEQRIKRRAATGALPPGKTLADFGIQETEAP